MIDGCMIDEFFPQHKPTLEETQFPNFFSARYLMLSYEKSVYIYIYKIFRGKKKLYLIILS